MTQQSRWTEAVRQTWNERADWWDEMSEQNAAAQDRPTDLDRISAALHLKPGSRLLDAGCGTGQWACAFAGRGCKVTAIDLAPEMIARARAHSGADSTNPTFEVGDISHLPDPLAVYDAILARVVLQFVPNLVATLNELRRVLKPGGYLLASVPGALSPIYSRSWQRFTDPAMAVGITYLLPWELEQVMVAVGWRIVDGWPNFGEPNVAGPNSLDHSTLDQPLQQAACTTWTVIAH